MPRAHITPLVRAFLGASVVCSLTVGDAAAVLAADDGGPGSVVAPAPVRYQVRKGDSLSAIARRNHITVAQLAAANGISNVHLIVVGQWLVIPSPGAPVAAPTASPAGGVAPPASDPGGLAPLVYVLRKGDSLSAVARRFHTTVTAIVAANRIANPNRVPIGLQLVIPGTAAAAAPTTTVTTTVTTATTVPVPVATVASGPLPPEQLARLPEGLAASPERLALMPLFDRWSAEYGVSPSLLKALAWMESGWQPAVVSSSGAIGIGQLLPATATFVSEVLIRVPLDPWVAEDNIRMSSRYLAHLLMLTSGDVNLALAGYYQGLTSVRRDGMKATTAAYVNVVLTLQGRF